MLKSRKFEENINSGFVMLSGNFEIVIEINNNNNNNLNIINICECRKNMFILINFLF